MTLYLQELHELRAIITDMGDYSVANAFLLQILLEKYDGVAEQLYAMNCTAFQEAPEIIATCEMTAAILSDHQYSVDDRKRAFEQLKCNLKKAIFRNIRKYSHLQIIGSPYYN